MAWIELHQTIARHPKTLKLRRVLDVHRAEAVGLLVLLWLWAVEHADTGVLPDDAGMIADVCDWEGDAECFLSALVTTRWIDRQDGVLVIHNWEKYAGRLLEIRQVQREQAAERKRNERKRKAARAVSSASHVDVTRDMSVSHAPVTDMNHDHNHDHDPPMPPQGGGEVVSLIPRARDLSEAESAQADGHDRGPKYTSQFAAFWKAYPACERKTAKVGAFKTWQRHRLTDAQVARLMAALELDKAGESWRRDGGAYVPAPAAWLNKQRWHDDPAAAPLPGPAGDAQHGPKGESKFAW